MRAAGTILRGVFTHLEHAVEQVRQPGDLRRTSYRSCRRLHSTGLRQQHNNNYRPRHRDDYCDPIGDGSCKVQSIGIPRCTAYTTVIIL